MKLYSSNETYKLYNGNMLDMLEIIEPNSIDSIITDPPYGLTSIVNGKDGSFQRLLKGFMGKEWDGSGIEYNINAWRNCYEVLKPGGYLLAFGGSRRFHRVAVAIEDAGFEIRDTIMWLYGSGFPKSMNIGLAIDRKNGVESKVIGNAKSGVSSRAYQSEETTTAGNYDIKEAQNEWKGWGTALKPSYEPIIVARKPIENTVVDNVMKYGVGGINIDECRVESNGEIMSRPFNEIKDNTVFNSANSGYKKLGNPNNISDKLGRFPANTILTYDETDFKEVCGGFPNTNGGSKIIRNFEINRKGLNDDGVFNTKNCGFKTEIKNDAISNYGDNGNASRYFYCAKASKKDRDDGLDEFEETTVNDGRNTPIDNPYQRGETQRHNIHPTVKPMELMQYLIRLVTPKGGGYT